MNQKEQRFVKTVKDFYEAHGRHTLPWRKTKDPYRVLVSEIMLQQTQVDRVLPKYKSFINKWPTVQTLAQASLGEVLIEWQGLGYNRRAKLLHQCAQTVMAEHAGKFPKTYEELKTLPGIGPYTAGAIMAFVYNQAVPVLETNVRTVYVHHFYHDQTNIPEPELLTLVAKTLPPENVREWYWALMDYGARLKKTVGNLNKKTKAYTKQSKFAGSDRQIRGAIIRELGAGSYTRQTLYKTLDFESSRIAAQLKKLKDERMIVQTKQSFSLPH